MQNKTKETTNPKATGSSILLHKMLASTIQFPNNNPVTPTADTTHPERVRTMPA